MQYFNHVTVNTGHSRRSFRNEVADDVVQTMKEWFASMSAGETVNIYDDYFCSLLHSNNTMADFSVTVKQKSVEYDVLRFTVCLTSQYRKRCWQIVEGEGGAPEAPFIAVRLINYEFADPALGDFERCLAWGFVESKKNVKQ